MICSSLKRPPFVAVSRFSRRTLPQFGRVFGEQTRSLTVTASLTALRVAGKEHRSVTAYLVAAQLAHYCQAGTYAGILVRKVTQHMFLLDVT